MWFLCGNFMGTIVAIVLLVIFIFAIFKVGFFVSLLIFGIAAAVLGGLYALKKYVNENNVAPYVKTIANVLPKVVMVVCVVTSIVSYLVAMDFSKKE